MFDPTQPQFAPSQGPMPMPGMDDPTQGAVGPPMSLTPPGASGPGMPPQQTDMDLIKRAMLMKQLHGTPGGGQQPPVHSPTQGAAGAIGMMPAALMGLKNMFPQQPQQSPTPNSADPTMAGLFGPAGPGSAGAIY